MAVTNEQIHELLKQVQADIAVIKLAVADRTRLLTRMRQDDLKLEPVQNETQRLANPVDIELPTVE